MKKIFMTLIASMLLLSVSSYAVEINKSDNQMMSMSKVDAQKMFGQTSMDIKTLVLDNSEMAKTEGEWFPIAFRFGYHGAHHTFRWIGRSRHFQMNWWRPGVRGSGGAVRIPWAWWK